MKILMMTNTYKPHVGGVAESVDRLTDACRRKGHRVLVVAPQFPDQPEDEEDIIRLPAIQNFNGSDFSMSLPAPLQLRKALDRFQPEIIHTHHPYLLGDTALRVAAVRDIPLILTYHTMYEKYTHYVPADSPLLKRFVIELSVRFTNLCDHVIAPSQSVAEIIRERGTTAPVSVIPTGVDYDRFSSGDGGRIRRELSLPDDAWVEGHVGRLAPEKNLDFLAQSVAEFLGEHSTAHFLVAGDGPSRKSMETIFLNTTGMGRIHFLGVRQDQDLIDCYHAMDVFAFSSQSETQGLVLAEAMAAGVPVVALDGPGVRDVVEDGYNGILLEDRNEAHFADALHDVYALLDAQQKNRKQSIDETAQRFSSMKCADDVLQVYDELRASGHKSDSQEQDTLDQVVRAVKREWDIWEKRVSAGIQSVSESEKE
ncbi:MAG TPA: glycosyltransferase [bacterium]|nr:glycosyltransferase [bacterium]